MYDAIVIGLGGMGSAAAYELAGRGKRVLGLESYTAPHDKGSSHGKSRIIRRAYAEGPEYVPLLLRAYELWEKLEAESGEELVTLTGGLMIGAPESGVIRGSVQSAEEHGLPYETLDASDLKRRFPAFVPGPGTVALYEERAGLVRPEATVFAHLDRAARLGAELRFGEPVLSWEVSGGEVRVVSAGGTYEAERLIVSAGAWASRLLEDLGLPLEVTRQILFWFEPKRGAATFAADRFPIFIWEPEDGNAFYGIPAHDGDRGVKAAFYRADGKPCDPNTVDRKVREQEVEFIRSYLERYVPDLSGRCLEAKTCLYTNTPDERFVISAHPDHPEVVIACGFSGHGYKFCSVVGEILADLATEGSTRHPIAPFSPARLKRG